MTTSAARYDRQQFSDRTVVTDEGYLSATPVVTRTGVFIYLDADGKERRELRHPDEVFNADSMESLKLRPITNGHPSEGLVSAGNAKRLSIGNTGETITQDGENLRSRIIITDAEGISFMRATGRKELSLGYKTDLVPEQGEYRGERYDYRQTNIRYNHLAVVDKARAGSVAAIHLDQNDAVEITAMPNENLQKVVLDGISYNAAPEVANALNKAKTATEQATARADAAESNLTKTTAERDALKEKLEAAEKLDHSEEIAKQVKARVALEKIAGDVLADDTKLDEMDDAALKTAVVAKLQPAAKLDGCTADYLQARFDMAVEDHAANKGKGQAAQARGDGSNRNDGEDTQAAAQARMVAHMKNPNAKEGGQ